MHVEENSPLPQWTAPELKKGMVAADTALFAGAGIDSGIFS
jgi:hypothetical protein